MGVVCTLTVILILSILLNFGTQIMFGVIYLHRYTYPFLAMLTHNHKVSQVSDRLQFLYDMATALPNLYETMLG